MLAITTAGFDRNSLCWTQHEYGEKVLSGIIEDDSLFIFVACLDDPEHWENESEWIKANPNLNVSVQLESLQIEARQAKEMPTAFNTFLRLRLNVWTQQDVRWMPMDKWDACHGIDDGADPKQAMEAWIRKSLAVVASLGLTLRTWETWQHLCWSSTELRR